MKVKIIFAMVFICSGVMAESRNSGDYDFGAINNKEGWLLFWEDSFDASKLDENKWSRVLNGNSDWNRNMSSDDSLVEINNGVIYLKGVSIKEANTEKYSYLTAGLTSRNKFEFQHGKIEIRARFDSANGAWPALWLLGVNGAWPSNGEIDIMEHLNFDGFVYQTVHSLHTFNSKILGSIKNYNKASINIFDWNIYGCEFDDSKIIFSVNEKNTFIYYRNKYYGAEQWPFNQNFYLIMSMQIGGDWVNANIPNNPSHYPAYLGVDWVRFYKKVN